MKNLLLICGLLLCISVAKAQQIKVVYPGYISYFNLQTLIPDSVTWTILNGHLKPIATVYKRTNDFHSTDGRKNLKRDYARSGYDQGHNSPYDDNYYDENEEHFCFDYVNMFPQRHLLNAQTWLALEAKSRSYALKYGACRVKTSWMGIDKKIGIDGVVVPLYCIKQIWFKDSTKIYKMPNRDTVIKHNFEYYRIK